MTSMKTKLRQFVTAIFAAFNKSRFRRILAAIFAAFTIFLVSAPAAAQPFDNVWHVDEDAPGGNGLGWSTAFNNLQDALDEADDAQIPLGSDLIKVAQGVYIPTVETSPADPRSVTFSLNGSNFNNITIEGGYAGINEPNEPDPDVRNVNLYVTTLSGAIDNPIGDVCGPGNGNCFEPNPTPGCEDTACCVTVCSIDPLCCLEGFVWTQSCADIANAHCAGGGLLYGAYHVVTANSVDASTLLDGFTITQGSASGGPLDASWGGGMLITDSSLSIVRCLITGNSAPAHGGGAMHIQGNSNPPLGELLFDQQQRWSRWSHPH